MIGGTLAEASGRPSPAPRLGVTSTHGSRGTFAIGPGRLDGRRPTRCRTSVDPVSDRLEIFAPPLLFFAQIAGARRRFPADSAELPSREPAARPARGGPVEGSQ